MNKLKVQLFKFKPEHVDQIELRQEVGGRFFQNYDAWKESITEIGMNNPTFTGFLGKKLVGFGGVSMIWKGVGEAWVCFDKSLADKPRLVYVYTKKVLNRIIVEQDLHRVQATCRVDFPQAANFLEHVGFEIESVLHKFSQDGVDHFMYSMILDKENS